MKKRLISIFLVVSIIISVFAVSAINTSAAAKPTITSIRVYPNKINVNWTKVSNTSYYAVWVLNKSTGKWSAYPTSANYINFDSLKPGIEYGFQVRAVDYQGHVGSFSKSQGVKFTFPQKPALYSSRSGYGKRLTLFCGVKNHSTGFVDTWLPYATSYDIILYHKGKEIHYLSKSYITTIPVMESGQYSFKVRAYCVYKNKGYLSPWSDTGYSLGEL